MDKCGNRRDVSIDRLVSPLDPGKSFLLQAEPQLHMLIIGTSGHVHPYENLHKRKNWPCMITIITLHCQRIHLGSNGYFNHEIHTYKCNHHITVVLYIEVSLHKRRWRKKYAPLLEGSVQRSPINQDSAWWR